MKIEPRLDLRRGEFSGKAGAVKGEVMKEDMRLELGGASVVKEELRLELGRVKLVKMELRLSWNKRGW